MQDNDKEAARRPVRRRQTTSSGKKPIGRRPIGPKTMSVVLQVRLTDEVRAAVTAMGGSTWARGVLEAALKRAAKRGEKLPRAYLKTLPVKKSASTDD